MNYILFDDPIIRQHLLPLTLTRPVGDLRVGIQRIIEKWTDFLGELPSFQTTDYLQSKFPAKAAADTIFVNGAALPTLEVTTQIKALKTGESLWQETTLIALRNDVLTFDIPHAYQIEDVVLIKELPDIFTYNPAEIKADFQRITAGRTSQPITDRFTALYNESQIFVEEGAILKAVILNAEDGPIYIGKNTHIQEGSIIQGPFALCEGSTISLGAKIRQGVTVGVGCKVGGEVGQSVFQGYSNKGHDGYLGCSVIGEWCNLGANTNSSNLKNDWTNVKIWSYVSNQLEDTGKQFVGTFMGDYSRCGISTMFNTGTVVGVSTNVFGDGFVSKHIPSFSWGGGDVFEVFRFDKALQVARASMARRGYELDENTEAILRYIFNKCEI
jgi:UDP-N-acetylglucosamine diphosphorylase / glucose-1-phosphate thymidylyltransferase / UDP-N-acetylgalactosamine diphosphorylase / glucosamine-1-phosphate N-acetyltransferase / galactosamine-1-phosphate N-acetyltransferase